MKLKRPHKTPKVGDRVEYSLSIGITDTGFVIGSTESGEIVLAEDEYLGMPVNAANCTILSSGHEQECNRLRSRYQRKFPDKLLPLGDANVCQSGP